MTYPLWDYLALSAKNALNYNEVDVSCFLPRGVEIQALLGFIPQ